jgi:hypothetical protein
MVMTASAVLLLVGFFAAADFLGPQVRGWPALPPCAWRTFTGIPCPGCGGTRALACLAAGNLEGALTMNPAVAIATMGTILIGALALARPAVADRLLDRLAAGVRTRRARFALLLLLLAQVLGSAALRLPRG